MFVGEFHFRIHYGCVPFKLQKCDFIIQAAVVSDKFFVCANHPMAGYNEADGIPAYCTAYGLCRVAADAFGYFTVSIGLPPWDIANDLHDCFAKGREVFHAKGWHEIWLMAREINVKPTTGVVNDRW